jgi:hypothetical protein
MSSVQAASAESPKPCAVMCHYYRKRASEDSFLDSDNLSYDYLTTYLGVLNDREDPATITNPRMEFWWDPDDLYNTAFDMFERSQPAYLDETAGYANFTLSNVTPLNTKEGTYAIDVGARYSDVGFDVSRQITSGGLVPSSGSYTVNVYVTVHNATWTVT